MSDGSCSGCGVLGTLCNEAEQKPRLNAGLKATEIYDSPICCSVSVLLPVLSVPQIMAGVRWTSVMPRRRTAACPWELGLHVRPNLEFRVFGAWGAFAYSERRSAACVLRAQVVKRMQTPEWIVARKPSSGRELIPTFQGSCFTSLLQLQPWWIQLLVPVPSAA